MKQLCNSTMNRPTTPTTLKEGHRFRLYPFRSPLLGVSRFLSLPPGTEMVQFPGFALKDLCIQSKSMQLLHCMGCPIRKSPDLWMFAPTRGLSQLTTSFIACLCQGIHRVPLLT